MTGDDTSVTVEKWDADRGTLRALRLKTGPGFPAHPRQIFAVYANQIQELAQHDGGLELVGKSEAVLNHFSHDASSSP